MLKWCAFPASDGPKISKQIKTRIHEFRGTAPQTQLRKATRDCSIYRVNVDAFSVAMTTVVHRGLGYYKMLTIMFQTVPIFNNGAFKVCRIFHSYRAVHYFSPKPCISRKYKSYPCTEGTNSRHQNAKPPIAYKTSLPYLKDSSCY